MNRTFVASVITAITLGASTLGSACSDEVETETEEIVDESSSAVAAEDAATDTELRPKLLRRFQSLREPVQPRTPSEQARVALGERLFNDPGLSADGKISCRSCHASKSHNGKVGARTAPSVTSANEMGATETSILAYLTSQPSYRGEFAVAFPGKDSLSVKSVSRALAAYERTLPRRSRWDAFLDGDEEALSAEEKNGLKTFLEAGCTDCHAGPYLGAATFEKVGVVQAWPNQNDERRFPITHHEADKMALRVPGLRNVGETAPYFHDGSAASLPEAVELMARHQLGIDLSPEEVDAIVTWLQSLTEEQ